MGQRTDEPEGDFSRRPFPEALGSLLTKRATGVLTLARGDVRKAIRFVEGIPEAVKSNLKSETLGLILLREGLISSSTYDELIRRQGATRRTQAQTLMEMRAVSEPRLVYALDRQIEIALLDAFSLNVGEFHFATGEQSTSRKTTLKGTVFDLIHEGVTLHFDAARIAESQRDVDAKYVQLREGALEVIAASTLRDEESQVLQAANGKSTVAALKALDLVSAEDVDRLIYVARCVDMIRLHDESPIARRSSGKPPAPSAGDAPKGSSKKPRESSGEGGAPKEPSVSEIRAGLAATLLKMQGQTYYQVLGISPKSSREEILSAYTALTKAHDPQPHAASPSPKVRQLADAVHAMIVKSSEILTDPRQRRAYDKGASARARKVLANMLAAEGRFHKGQLLLTECDFHDAARLFQEAIELHGGESEFHAYLGWSLFQTAPSDDTTRERALVEIDLAISLNPKTEKGHLFAGYVHKAAQRTTEARRSFEKALEVHPKSAEALREVNRLGK